MSTDRIYSTVTRIAARYAGSSRTSRRLHLDVGAGTGQLICEMRTKGLSLVSIACDIRAEQFPLRDVRCDRVDLNRERIPYPDENFDLVTSSEVIEHLENYREVLREAFRVLKPGGAFIATTPNVVNVKSRVRYLYSGFPNLFGPLPLESGKAHSIGGHITPVPYFYLGHALRTSGFVNVRVDIDKVESASAFWLALLFPVLCLGMLYFIIRESTKYKTITAQNRSLVASHLSLRLLVGRTIIVSAVKPSGAEGAQS